jgi:hypothetical protein
MNAPVSFGQPVIADAHQLGRDVGSGHGLRRRVGHGQHLAVAVAERVHHAEPGVEVIQRRHLAHALADIGMVGRHRHHLVEVARRKDVIEDVDFHGRVQRDWRAFPIGAQ